MAAIAAAVTAAGVAAVSTAVTATAVASVRAVSTPVGSLSGPLAIAMMTARVSSVSAAIASAAVSTISSITATAVSTIGAAVGSVPGLSVPSEEDVGDGGDGRGETGDARVGGGPRGDGGVGVVVLVGHGVQGNQGSHDGEAGGQGKSVDGDLGGLSFSGLGLGLGLSGLGVLLLLLGRAAAAVAAMAAVASAAVSAIAAAVTTTAVATIAAAIASARVTSVASTEGCLAGSEGKSEEKNLNERESVRSFRPFKSYTVGTIPYHKLGVHLVRSSVLALDLCQSLCSSWLKEQTELTDAFRWVSSQFIAGEKRVIFIPIIVLIEKGRVQSYN